MGLLSGGLALGGGLAGLFGAGAQAPPQFQMPNMGGAAGSAYSGIGGLSNFNTYAPNIGSVQGITSNLVNNPYAGGYQAGANTAGGLGETQALGQYGVGQSLTNLGTNVLPQYAGAVMNTAFDPQQALYNRTFGQVSDQSNAALAQAGVGTTPYGAGIQGQNLANFNIDWQNQQLNRQTQGLGAASSALGQGGQLAQAGQGLSAAAPNQYLQSAGIPYGTYGSIGSNQIGALNTLGQFGQSASNLPQTQIQDYLGYLGQGTSQQSANNQSAALAAQIQAMYGKSIGQGLSALGGAGYGIGGSGYGSLFGGTSLPSSALGGGSPLAGGFGGAMLA